jgi:hypothetical protein
MPALADDARDYLQLAIDPYLAIAAVASGIWPYQAWAWVYMVERDFSKPSHRLAIWNAPSERVAMPLPPEIVGIAPSTHIAGLAASDNRAQSNIA